MGHQLKHRRIPSDKEKDAKQEGLLLKKALGNKAGNQWVLQGLGLVYLHVAWKTQNKILPSRVCLDLCLLHCWRQIIAFALMGILVLF